MNSCVENKVEAASQSTEEKVTTEHTSTKDATLKNKLDEEALDSVTGGFATETTKNTNTTTYQDHRLPLGN